MSQPGDDSAVQVSPLAGHHQVARAGRPSLQVGHVFCDHCVTGPVVGEALPERHLPGSSSRLSPAEQSTVWNSSVVSRAKTARPGCGGKSEALSPSSRMKLFGAALTGRRRCDRDWPSAAPAPPRRSVSGCSRRGGVHRSPEPGDLTEPPGDRLLGGTGGSVVAEVADQQFGHLAHQVHGRGQEIGAAESALSTACLSPEPPIESSGRGSKALLAGHVGLDAAGAGCRQ